MNIPWPIDERLIHTSPDHREWMLPRTGAYIFLADASEHEARMAALDSHMDGTYYPVHRIIADPFDSRIGDITAVILGAERVAERRTRDVTVEGDRRGEPLSSYARWCREMKRRFGIDLI